MPYDITKLMANLDEEGQAKLRHCLKHHLPFDIETYRPVVKQPADKQTRKILAALKLGKPIDTPDAELVSYINADPERVRAVAAAFEAWEES